MPEVILNGPGGRLEGRYHHSSLANAPVVLLLHPHPKHGGSMNNKVIYTLFRAFVKRDFSALRFNFRGVGRSQGTFDQGQGELSDAASALDWLQSHNPDAQRCWIGGFSFGAWISMQLLMRRPEIETYISISPPASLYDFSFLAPCPASGMFLQGDADELVEEAEVAKLAEKLSNQRGIPVDYRVIKGANHFFQDKADTLIGHVDDYLSSALGGKTAAK